MTRVQQVLARMRSAPAIRAGTVATLAVVLLAPESAGAYHRALAAAADAPAPYGLSADCTLQYYNICSCYLWVYSDQEHAVWGSVFDPEDCPGGCMTGGAVKEIRLFSVCATAPATLDAIRIQTVDAAGCPTALLYDSGGPIDIVHCVIGDHWTTIPVPLVHVGGRPFVVQVEWGPTGSLQIASDNPWKNYQCYSGSPEGCLLPGCGCSSWEIPPQRSFIYVTDRDGDGTLDDLCSDYGAPEAITSYVYSDVPDNLLISVVLDCQSPTATEAGTWGRVKHLFE